MKKLILLFVLITNITFAQQVSVPTAKTYLLSTNGQDGSGFVLGGFGSTATLLASISLVNPPTGTTFNLTTTTGLTAASGFTLNGNKTRLVVTGTMGNINTALSSLKVNTGSVSGNVQISVAATVNPAGFFYNGTNGHFYRPISSGTTYTNARAAALNTTFKGQQGYLVTITSPDEDAFVFNNVPQTNIWFALTDEAVEGQWRIDAGPERGTLIKTSNGQFTGNIQGQYNNWAPGEPNNSGNEDYAVTKWNGSQWNDLPNNFSCPYVIEYGTWTNPDDATFTEFYTNSVIHSNGDVLRTQFNFEFGSNIDETKFSTNIFTYTNFQTGPFTLAKTGTSSIFLNGLGRVDMTPNLDVSRIGVANHAILFDEYNQAQLQTLYNQIVTVSDVYLAFSEYSDRGLFGNESKYFQSGVQFQNADVDNNNIFDERDCYLLLQHLHGSYSLWESVSLNQMMKLFPKSIYNNLTKSNWNSYNTFEFLGAKFPIAIANNTLNSYDVSVTWRGDVNLSHSVIPTPITTPTNSINNKTLSTNSQSNSTNTDITADIILESVGDLVVATLSLNPNDNKIGATQFNVYFDNLLLDYVGTSYSNELHNNFAKNNFSHISLGTLNTSGGIISNIEYKVTFKPKTPIKNLLGIISVENVETIGVGLNKLNVKII